MSKFVARRGQLGLALEATRGVPVSPTHFLPWATMSFKDATEEQRETQGLGVLASQDSRYVTMKMGEGEVEAQLYDRALGLILIGLTGASPVTTGSNPYTHTYTPSQTNQGKSLSLYWKDPDRSEMFPLAMLDSLKLSVEPSGLVQWTVGFKSKTSRDWAIQTPVYTSLGNKFLHQHLQFRLATTIGGLAAASPISLKKLELSFNRNTMYDAVIGTVEPEDILNQEFAIEGSLALNLEDDTYHDYMMDGTYRAAEVKLLGSSSSSVAFQFPRVDFSEWEPDRALAEITKQNVNIKMNYDTANGLDIMSSCVLINGQVNYA